MQLKPLSFAAKIFILCSCAVSGIGLAFETKSCLVLDVQMQKPTPVKYPIGKDDISFSYDTVKMDADGTFLPINRRVYIYTQLRYGEEMNKVVHAWRYHIYLTDRHVRTTSYNRGMFSFKKLDLRKLHQYSVDVMDEEGNVLEKLVFRIEMKNGEFVVRPISAGAIECPTTAWLKDPKPQEAEKSAEPKVIAEKALEEDKPHEAPQEKAITDTKEEPQEIPADSKPKEKEPEKILAEPWVTPSFDVIPQIGYLFPLFNLAEDVKPALFYGIGLAKDLVEMSNAAVSLSLMIGRSTTKPKESSLSGTLTIMPIIVNATYQYSLGEWRPYVGLGFGSYRWGGKVTQVSTQISNDWGGTSNGYSAHGGVGYAIMKELELGPHLSAHRGSGYLKNEFWTLGLALKWRLFRGGQ